jgi:Winged helix-turn-helix DNA-binding
MLEPLLPHLKREIEARLAELRPLVAEAERLAAAKDAMLAEAAAEGAARLRATRASRLSNGFRQELRNGASSTPLVAAVGGHRSDSGEEDDGGRAPRGANQEAILAIVEERPGVSVAEIASVTKIAKPTVATTVSKLKREGVLAEEAGGVKLASRRRLTLSEAAAGLASQRDEGVGDDEWEAARRDPAAA